MRWFVEHFTFLLSATFVVASAVLFVRLFVIRKRPLVSMHVREASHALANETTQLRARIEQIKRTKDPVQTLVQVLTRTP